MMRTIFPAFLFLALVGPAANAQEEDESEKPTLPQGFDRDSARRRDLVEELTELFHQIERKLEEIDAQLADAGAGESPLDEVEDSGLDRLLRESRQKSEEVIGGIDRILEIAQEMGGGGGGMGGQPQEPQQGPLDQERDRGPTDRENTPEAPGEKPGSEERPEDEPQDSSNEGPGQDHERGENREGDPRTDLLKDADAISYFDVNLSLYYERNGWEETLRRCEWGYRRLSVRMRKVVEHMSYENQELNALLAQAIRAAGVPSLSTDGG